MLMYAYVHVDLYNYAALYMFCSMCLDLQQLLYPKLFQMLLGISKFFPVILFTYTVVPTMLV